jgi:predicted GTPase
MVIAVNKWDTIKDKKELMEEIHYKLGQFTGAGA